jgi:hypothetical protein
MKEFISLWPIGLIALGIIISLILPERKPTGVLKIKELNADELKDFKKAWREANSGMINHIREQDMTDVELAPKEKKAYNKK